MPSKRDYYDILGVSKDASDQQIKQAYRRSALEWHPDRNSSRQANDKFKEINEAYEVLSNQEKRAAYDQFGHAAFTPGRGFAGQEPFNQTYQKGPFTYTYTSYGSSPFEGVQFDFGGFSDPFEIFEQFFSGASPFSTRGRIRFPRYGLTLTFMEAAQGCEKEITHQGKKRKVKIPAGVDDGSRIKFDDFYVSVDVLPHKIFKRDGVDIVVNQKIPFATAILGGTITVPTIDGEVKLKIRPGTQPGTMMRLRGKGIPVLHRGLFEARSQGDQYIQLIITLPTKLTSRQKELLEEFEKAG